MSNTEEKTEENTIIQALSELVCKTIDSTPKFHTEYNIYYPNEGVKLVGIGVRAYSDDEGITVRKYHKLKDEKYVGYIIDELYIYINADDREQKLIICKWIDFGKAAFEEGATPKEEAELTESDYKDIKRFFPMDREIEYVNRKKWPREDNEFTPGYEQGWFTFEQDDEDHTEYDLTDEETLTKLEEIVEEFLH